MINLFKNKVVTILLIIGLFLIAVFSRGLYSKNNQVINNQAENQTQNQSPKIISTNPTSLDESTILPTQAISITFNTPLQNIPELKYTLDPNTALNIELSDDRKTVKFTPVKNFELGQGYSLHIGSETKFDGKKTLGDQEKTFHFTTISYSGV